MPYASASRALTRRCFPNLQMHLPYKRFCFLLERIAAAPSIRMGDTMVSPSELHFCRRRQLLLSSGGVYFALFALWLLGGWFHRYQVVHRAAHATNGW